MVETAKSISTSMLKGIKTETKASPKLAVAVDGKTLPEAYLRRLEISGNDTMLRVKRDGQYRPLTWNDYHKKVLAIFAGHRKLELKKGDKVCIFSQSCPEWMMVDYANLAYGAVSVPIYHSNSVEDVKFILEHCEAKLVFVDDEGATKKLAQAFEMMKRTIPVVSFSNKKTEFSHFSTIGFEDYLVDEEREKIHDAFTKSVMALSPESVASIVYTSGTTGQPKGAVLTHTNFSYEIRTIVRAVNVDNQDSTLTFLPFAHIMGRVESTLPIYSATVLNFAENINSVATDIAEVGPTLLISVPRIFEKVYSKIQTEIQSQPETKQKIFRWAVSVGRRVAILRSEKKAVPITLQAQNLLADRLVFSRIRAKLGGRLRISLSGGAPLSRELCEFFNGCGITIVEAYGLTETSAAITTNRPDDLCFGTVGRPLDGIDIQIAEDGEILTRGPVIFKEYYRNPEATAEAFKPGGWFCTGDIGEINERGFLKITDRKKELIVTSGGKKVAPQKLENLLKTCRWVSNAMVFGDKQKYLVTLITLTEPEVKKWATEQKLSFSTYEDLVKLPEIIATVEKEVKSVNGQLASFESIKKFSILPADFTIETGELTPSLKVKRKVVIAKYQSYIDKMYS